jgi:hypothetical protein
LRTVVVQPGRAYCVTVSTTKAGKLFVLAEIDQRDTLSRAAHLLISDTRVRINTPPVVISTPVSGLTIRAASTLPLRAGLYGDHALGTAAMAQIPPPACTVAVR